MLRFNCLTLFQYFWIGCFVGEGCKNAVMGLILKEIFQTSYFRIVVVPDEEAVEVCGALKVLVLGIYDAL